MSSPVEIVSVAEKMPACVLSETNDFGLLSAIFIDAHASVAVADTALRYVGKATLAAYSSGR